MMHHVLVWSLGFAVQRFRLRSFGFMVLYRVSSSGFRLEVWAYGFGVEGLRSTCDRWNFLPCL